jgi:4-amino-4-deoxy-L-arabinose transferase-like glycosyltransferase
MQLWDEIRLANNAIEMAETGSLLVTRYNGEPDAWNTKPPMQIWFEASGVKVFGIRPLAFRLPSALAALATVLLLFRFARRELNSLWSGALAAVLLLSCSGYVLIHTARNGEYDALLVLWMLASSVSLFRFVWGGERKWLWLTALFMVLAVYTKGIQGLIFFPGFLIYAAAVGRFGAVFRRRQVYAAAGVGLLTIGLYYAAREQLQPGYLRAVWDNELFGRYAVVNEDHHASFRAYFVSMGRWTLFLFYGILALPLMKGAERRIGLFTVIIPVSYLLVISLSKTKLEWYTSPVYPFVALLVVVTLRSVIVTLRAKAEWIRPAMIALACIAALWSVSALAIKVDQRDHALRAEEEYPKQLAMIQEAHPGVNHVVLGTPVYQGPSLYYQKYFALRGLVVELQDFDRLSLHKGDTILTSTSEIKRRLRDDYDTQQIFSFSGMEGAVVR